MLALINWRIWAAGALALALIGSHWKAYTSGKASVQAVWNAEKLEQSNQSRKLLEKVAADSADLQTQVDKTQGDKNDQIQALNSRVDDLNSRLRNRPTRPSGANLPTTASDGQAASGCTGAQLYRGDSEVLTRIGRDADELRIQLKACYVQYDTARAKFETVIKKE